MTSPRMTSQSPLRALWLTWQSLRLPWRRKWLVGQDLTGVTFWEHAHNPLSNTRPRRTAKYPRSVHPGDVSLTPAWLQWLRHTRPLAPSIPEQVSEQARQAGMLQLAAEADRRWEEKGRYIDRPARQSDNSLQSNETAGGSVPRTTERVSGATGAGGAAPAEADGAEPVSNVYAQRPGSEKSKPDDSGAGQSASAERMETEKAKKKPHSRQPNYTGPGEAWQPQAWTPGKVERR